MILLEDLCDFYRENLAQGLSDFTNLDYEGFICIQSFFVLINTQNGRLQNLADPAQACATQQKKGILKNSKNSKVTSISSDKGAVVQQLNFSESATTPSTQASKTQTTQIETGSSAITGGVAA